MTTSLVLGRRKPRPRTEWLSGRSRSRPSELAAVGAMLRQAMADSTFAMDRLRSPATDRPGAKAVGMGAPHEEYVEFVRARSQALLRSAYLLTGDQQLAEDLVQEALARTHVAWSRLRQSGNVEAYARKVMYHTQVSLWRRRRVAEVLPAVVPERVDGHDLAEDAVRRLTVEHALRALSPRQRAVVVLRYFEDRTESEAAELLGVSVGTVRTQLDRALARLRQVVPALETTRGVEGRDA
jgi:RNA polymerase sigma-70 factor (sigma-E family)